MTSKKILIIDDQQEFIAMLKEGLESADFKVAVAYDGLQGVLQAHQMHPDVILLDFKMPGVGGAEVYDRLRSASDTAGIPVIFTTGLGIDQVKEHVRPGPKTYFLKKPVSVAQVKSVLGRILGITIPTGSVEEQASKTQQPSGVMTSPPRFSPFLSRPDTESATKSEPTPPPEPKPTPVPMFTPQPKKEPKLGRAHELEVRVTYGDTDQIGIIYYANYFRYFEQGRTELLRSIGLSYRDLEKERKLYLPVAEAHCRYLNPGHYDDVLVVRTWLEHVGHASMEFHSEIMDRKTKQLLSQGYTRHAFVDDSWKPTQIPPDIKTLLEPYVIEKA